MARVERRMYRYRQKRARRRWVLAGVVLVGIALAVLLGRRPSLIAERIAQPTATPITAQYDQTIETREVTLGAETWYAIQTGVFSTSEAAQEKASAYTERGAPGTVVQDGEKWRVFIACYGSEADATAVRQRLGTNQRVETYLYRWTCPELRLRLTGMAGQLDVVEAGFALVRQSAEALRDAATQLDAGELTTAEAAQAVGDMDSRITLWAQTARARFGKAVPEIVQGLLRVTDGWDAQRRQLEKAAGSPTELSAALKGQGMALYDALITLRAQINATSR